MNWKALEQLAPGDRVSIGNRSGVLEQATVTRTTRTLIIVAPDSNPGFHKRYRRTGTVYRAPGDEVRGWTYLLPFVSATNGACA